jgi:hypothetical protein
MRLSLRRKGLFERVGFEGFTRRGDLQLARD